MVLVAWVWISGLGQPGVDDTQPVSTTITSTTAPGDTENAVAQIEDEETTTTTTPVLPNIDAHLQNLADAKETLAEVVAETNAVDNEWTNRDITYRKAVERLDAVTKESLVFSYSIASHPPHDSIPGWSGAHQELTDLAATAATAAEALLSWMTQPDGHPPMRSPLPVLHQVVESFYQGIDQLIDSQQDPDVCLSTLRFQNPLSSATMAIAAGPPTEPHGSEHAGIGTAGRGPRASRVSQGLGGAG